MLLTATKVPGKKMALTTAIVNIDALSLCVCSATWDVRSLICCVRRLSCCVAKWCSYAKSVGIRRNRA